MFLKEQSFYWAAINYVVFLDVVARHFEFELQNFKLGGKDIEKL